MTISRSASGTPHHQRLFSLLLLLLLVAQQTSTSPIQYLPNIPGYIPVYIRYGNQPLDEIHPGLAEAFHEPPSISQNLEGNRLDKELTYKNEISSESKEEEPVISNDAHPMVLTKISMYEIPIKESSFSFNTKPSDKDSVVMKISKTKL